MKSLVLLSVFFFFSGSLYAQQVKEFHYTAWDCYGLRGAVSTMTTSDGDTLRFDRQGELIDRDGNRPLDFSDEWHEPFVISFPDKFTRHESRSSESIVAKTDNWFIFDQYGRIVRKQLRPYIEWQEVIYLYSLQPTDYGEKEFPLHAIIRDSDDEESTFYFLDYYYETFDQAGNWTNRRVISRRLNASDTHILFIENLDTEKPYSISEITKYTETAQYTYH